MTDTETKGETPDADIPLAEGGDREGFLPTFLNEHVGVLCEKSIFSDVTFKIGDKKIPAHRLILAAHSIIFEEMLFPKRDDGTFDPALKAPIEVEIKDTDPSDFSALLQCIYTDKADVDAGNIQSLIKIATKYQVEKLKLVCAEFMEGDVNKDNIFDLFQLAPTMLGDEEFGLKFIEEHADELLQSEGITKLTKERFAVILKDSKLNVGEIEVFKALEKWGKAEVKRSKEKTDLKTVVKDLIQHIRFPTMEVSDIASVVAPSLLLEQTQLVSLFSYLSVTDEKVRALLPDPGYPSEPREGTSSSNWHWDTTKKGSAVTLSNSNMTAVTSGSGWNYGLVLGTKEFKKGDHYWEVKIDHSSNDMIGVCAPNVPYNSSSVYSNYPSQCWFCHHSSGTYGGSIGVKGTLYLGATTGDTVGIHLQWNKSSSTYDMNYYRNRALVGTPFRNIPPPLVAATELYSSPARVTLNTKVKKP